MYIYKITTQENWQKSQVQENLILSDMDKEFIHFATEKQVDKVIEKFFTNQQPVILKINTKMLPGNLVFESNRPGGDKYYHLYGGYIPMHAISAVLEYQ